MRSLGFVARASLMESGYVDPAELAAEEAYYRTRLLLEREEESRAMRYGKTALKAGAGLGAAYLAGAGGLGAYRAYGKGGRAMAKGALAQIKNPKSLGYQALRKAQRAWHGSGYGLRVAPGMKGKFSTLGHRGTTNIVGNVPAGHEYLYNTSGAAAVAPAVSQPAEMSRDEILARMTHFESQWAQLANLLEKDDSRAKRYAKGALKAGAGLGAGYLVGMGGLGAGSAALRGASMGGVGRAAMAHIASPIRSLKRHGAKISNWWDKAARGERVLGRRKGIQANRAAYKRQRALDASMDDAIMSRGPVRAGAAYSDIPGVIYL